MLLQTLQNNFTQYAAHNAFYINNTFYTYAQLGQKANSIALWLAQQNPQKKPVAIVAYNHFDTYTAILGVLLSGAAYVPILPNYPINRVHSILQQAQTAVVLCPLPQWQANGYTVTQTDSIPTVQTTYTIPTPMPASFAYILFTSGSTGVPKGVPISHQNLQGFLTAFNTLGYGLNHNDRVLQMFDLTFDLSVVSYLAPLLVGACVYVVPDDGIKYMSIYSLFEDHELTFSLMVPSMLNYLRPYFEDIHLPHLRHSLFCGEALYADIAQEWQKCIPNGKIENVYGPTEATIFCLTYPCVEHLKQYNGILSIGKPMFGIHTIVVDDNSKPVEKGDKGELCLAGEQVTQGYLSNEEKNQEAFFNYQGNRYYRTGDIVFEDKNNDYLYCGRADHQVKVKGGFRVELNEIEAHARNYTPKSGVAAIAKATDIGIHQIFLFLEGYEGDVHELKEYLKTQMPDYMLPEKILKVSAFPLNNNGKIDRKALGDIIPQNRP